MRVSLKNCIEEIALLNWFQIEVIMHARKLFSNQLE